MRDKNLSLSQFNIQLEKTIIGKLPTDDWFSRIHVSDTPTCQEILENLEISYPRDFRLLRSLSIAQWYFPEFLHWRVLLDLKEKSFSQLNSKQKIELEILLSSKENMQIYLFETERYSSGEIFGNILGNDLRDLRKLSIHWKVIKRPLRKTRHRGYRDHGSRRPDHRWLPSFDVTLTEVQLKKEHDSDLLQRTINRILVKLRELLLKSK